MPVLNEQLQEKANFSDEVYHPSSPPMGIQFCCGEFSEDGCSRRGSFMMFSV